MSAPASFFSPFFWIGSNPPPAGVDEEEEIDADQDSYELIATSLLAIVSCIAYFVFENPLFLVVCVGSSALLATKLVKKLLNGYSFLMSLEEFGLILYRKVPYIHIIASLIAIAFSWYVVWVSTIAASSAGILSGINQESFSHQRFYEERSELEV